MNPGTWCFSVRTEGSHRHVAVRCGLPGKRSLLGHLTMSQDEWDELERVLVAGAVGLDLPYGTLELVDEG
jgi:hypothetical protein